MQNKLNNIYLIYLKTFTKEKTMVFYILSKYLPFQINEYFKKLNLITREECEKTLTPELIEYLIPSSDKKDFYLNFFKRIDGKLSQSEIILYSTFYEMKQDIENFKGTTQSKIKIKQWIIEVFTEYRIPFLICNEIQQLSSLDQIQHKIVGFCNEFTLPENKISYDIFFMTPEGGVAPALIVLYSHIEKIRQNIEIFKQNEKLEVWEKCGRCNKANTICICPPIKDTVSYICSCGRKTTHDSDCPVACYCLQ